MSAKIDYFAVHAQLRTHDNLDKAYLPTSEYLKQTINQELVKRRLTTEQVITIQFNSEMHLPPAVVWYREGDSYLGCGRCHDCGTILQPIQSGLEWCPACQSPRNYRSHTSRASGDMGPCPSWDEFDKEQAMIEQINGRAGAYVEADTSEEAERREY